MLELLIAPFAACMLFAALHCYMGLHVIRRGVIFVDLALAQMAALGSTVALVVSPMILSPHNHAPETVAATEAAQSNSAAPASDPLTTMGEEEDPREEIVSYVFSLSFAFLGAALFSMFRFRDNRVPHEALIGICYVVSAALAMLVLNKAPHGSEKIEAMMLGSILFVNWGDVTKIAILYSALAVPHIIWGRKFLKISTNIAQAEAEGMNVRFWDFFFYAIFGFMVTESVRIGGVLVIFSFLIIPGVCAAIFFRSFWKCLIFGWTIAVLASIAGLWFSAAEDMPTGASLVAAFGGALALCAISSRFISANPNLESAGVSRRRRNMSGPIPQ
ncbi:metal ABC transporter permease, partial [Candidatus Sumerlaeota bacterium]|nr:metal ABC transporter permease [Candidatus Sumerlaeota bacterium]